MPVTLSDVAKAAGVSQATASRAIHGAKGRTVRPELRARVLAAADKLKYSADANAQAMARGKTTAIGLIVPDISDPYFSSIAAGVAHRAEAHGLVVTLAATDRVHTKEIDFIRLMHGQRARAIILAGGREDNPTHLQEITDVLAEYRASGGQVAIIGGAILDSVTVKISNYGGARELAAALLGLNYRTFAVLAGPKGHQTARDRYTGFVSALTGANDQLLSRNTVYGQFSWQGGYDAMTSLLNRGVVGTHPENPKTIDRVDAVFAVSDLIALGAMAAVRDHGLRIGEDVMLAGFGDISTLRDVTPGLTTVSLPLNEIGMAALDLALAGESERVESVPDAAHLDTQVSSPAVEIKGRVIIRRSTPEL